LTEARMSGPGPQRIPATAGILAVLAPASRTATATRARIDLQPGRGEALRKYLAQREEQVPVAVKAYRDGRISQSFPCVLSCSQRWVIPRHDDVFMVTVPGSYLFQLRDLRADQLATAFGRLASG